MFVDVFGGSGTVLINTKAEHYMYNDINPYVSSIFEGLVTEDTDEVVKKIEDIITKYSLSKTNKEGFERLRDDYNAGRNDWITLYTLMCHSFNHQFRFNNNHQYNSSFGKEASTMNDSIRNNLNRFVEKLHSGDYTFCNKKFDEFDFSDFDSNDFVYCDPPYSIGTGVYQDGKRGFNGWSKEDDKKLFAILDKLNEKDVKFAMSNVFENKGLRNEELIEWSKKYKVHHLRMNYNGANYQRKESKSDEVLITNY